ncbi:hypothetical protein N7508_005271 [Penicillium antarcticum]|uniref:uncharacterized protein n=1 Tax=Penicillium antarcticum TaxID=416450 RepID=UPI0023914E84|nr:uncharacterized protein N7508_005271 [Penicillium antarcticum]KAJ5306256.1 hypothetical protein N7508_005271 [Penicillium antarcticum]
MSKAAKFNAHVLKKLQIAVKKDPEIDLAEQFPTDYPQRLVEMRESIESSPKKTKFTPQSLPEADEDIRRSLCPSDPVEILFPLSDAVADLLESVSQSAKALPAGLSQRLFEVLQNSDVLWKAPFARQKGVFKCSADIVVKAVRNMKHYTEYTTLQYLDRHKPNILAPKPLGLVQGAPLGGIAGEGCQDLRRHVRMSEAPIFNLEDFETFLFSSSHPGGDVFVKFLRRLSLYFTAHSGPRIVFTHGDLRPDNVMVELADNNQYMISGILDWEYSGFYPDYYESVRCTNCLSPYEENDWFLYLPECVSPNIYAQWWLLDRVRETRIV